MNYDGGFGWSVSRIGDVNGDSLGDLIVGAPYYPFFPPIEESKGYWAIYLGSHNIGVTSVQNGQGQIPTNTILYQNYPNPFNPTTEIKFSIPNRAYVILRIFDLLGREVAMLANEMLGAGVHTVTWNARTAASGVYFYQLRVGSFSQTKKLVLVR
jgi:hypothetical protein